MRLYAISFTFSREDHTIIISGFTDLVKRFPPQQIQIMYREVKDFPGFRNNVY